MSIRKQWPALAAAAVLLATLARTGAAAAPALRAPGGAVLVNGKPRLILGLYENPTDDAMLRQAITAGFNLFHCGADAKELDRVHRAGAMAWISVGGDLDLSRDGASRRARLVATARKFAGHPALLLWEGPDEAPWNEWSGPPEYVSLTEWPAMDRIAKARGGAEGEALAQLRAREMDLQKRALWADAEKVRREFWRRAGENPPQPEISLTSMPRNAARVGDGLGAGMRALRAADPRHMIWLNHAPRNSLSCLARCNREADMVGCDIYPLPYNLWVTHSDLVNMRPTSVGEYTDRMRTSAPGKSCAMVLQGFGWRDLDRPGKRTEDVYRFGVGRRPSFQDTRFMAYNAILHGANAVMYWGTAYSHREEPDPVTGPQPTAPEGSRLWRDILAVARELRALEPALLAPEAARLQLRVEETYGSIDGGGARASLRRVGSDWVLLVANENTEGVALTVGQLPRALEGRTLYRLGAAETHRVQRGAIRDGLAPFEVHVYATSRRFEPTRTTR